MASRPRAERRPLTGRLWPRDVLLRRRFVVSRIAEDHQNALRLGAAFDQLAKRSLGVVARLEPVLNNPTALRVEDHEHGSILRPSSAMLALAVRPQPRGSQMAFLFRLDVQQTAQLVA